jgi:ACS family glucarate transporter-like MFS transporter
MRSAEIWVLMVLASGLNYLGRMTMSIAAPDIMKEYRLTEPQLGVLFSAFTLAYAIFMAPSGWLSDRFGPRNVLGIGSALAAIMTAATGSIGPWPGAMVFLWLARFGFGAASAPLYPACARLVANWFPPGRLGFVQSSVVGASGLGASIAPPVCSWIITHYGWRSPFLLVGLAIALLAAVWLVRVRNGRLERRSSGGWALLRQPKFLLLLVAYWSLGYFYDFFDVWSYYYLREIRQLGTDTSAWLTSLLQATIVVTMPLGGWASDALASRFPDGRSWFAAIMLGMTAVLFTLGAKNADATIAVVLLCIAFGLGAGTDGAAWARAIELAPGHAAFAGGVLNTAQILGYFSSDLALPLLASSFGWSNALLSTGALALTASALWTWQRS